MIAPRFKKYLRPSVIIGGFFAVVVMVGLGIFSWQVVHYIRLIRSGTPDPFSQDRFKASATRALTQMPLSDLDASRIESKGSDPVLGNPAAKIRLVEFIDYECPFSSQSAPEVRAFVAKHPNDVAFVLRDFPLESTHDRAMDAAIAARCVSAQGGGSLFWRYHDLLFTYQNDLSQPKLRSYAEWLGVDMSTFDSCVATRAPEATIRASIQDGVAAGVRGTPTFFVNGRRIPGALNLPMLEAILAQLKKQI